MAITIDLMIRGGSLALLALWSWLLLRDHRNTLSARIATALLVSVAMHVVASLPSAVNIRPLRLFFELGAVCVPALFWLFARTWFNDAARIGWVGWLALVASVVMVMLVIATFGEESVRFYIFAAVLRALMLVLALLGLWEAWRGRDDDLIEARRALRVRLVGAVGAYVIITNGAEILIHNDLVPDVWRTIIELGILLLLFAFCATIFTIAPANLFGPLLRSEPVQRPASIDDQQALARRLRNHMETTLAWRDETLTIAALAAQLGEQEYRLRRAINGTLGHRNFAQFLNGYRLAEVKAALADPAQREVPILTIALDAGFGSLGPFNRAFREAEGMTPSEYRARAAG